MNNIEIHRASPGKPLLIAFGGLQGEMVFKLYEFKNYLRKNFDDINIIFVRDPNRAWYLRGIEEDVVGWEGNLELLNVAVGSVPHTNLITIGTSMGGWAAIFFGLKMNADTVLAFGPQTFIDDANRKRYNDKRWQKHIDNIQPHSTSYHLLDLKEGFSAESQTIIEILYAVDAPLDAVHAKHLQDFKLVQISEFEQGGHYLIKTLRDDGRLKSILETSLVAS